ILAPYDLPDTVDGPMVKDPSAIDGERRQVSLRRLFHEFKMRVLRIIEAHDMVSAAQGVQLPRQIQDHLFCPVQTSDAAQVKNLFVHQTSRVDRVDAFESAGRIDGMGRRASASCFQPACNATPRALCSGEWP